MFNWGESLINKRWRRLDQPFNVSAQCRVRSYQFFDDPGWCSDRVWARTSCSADRCSSDMGILISKNLVIWASPFSYYLSGLGLRYGYRGCPYYESFGNGDAQNVGMPISLWHRHYSYWANRNQTSERYARVCFPSSAHRSAAFVLTCTNSLLKKRKGNRGRTGQLLAIFSLFLVTVPLRTLTRPSLLVSQVATPQTW